MQEKGKRENSGKRKPMAGRKSADGRKSNAGAGSPEEKAHRKVLRKPDDKPFKKKRDEHPEGKAGLEKKFGKPRTGKFLTKKSHEEDKPSEWKKSPVIRKKRISKSSYLKGTDDGLIRLNKFIADAGICSRREADTLIEAGVIKVNGVVVTQVGTKVSSSDKVQYGDQTLSREVMRYVLLNKPKGFITTTDDPYERKTVMQIVSSACKERIYPVGRLDRNTTGLLLLTNDGDLAKKLTHPSHRVMKLYHVTLDKNLSKKDMLAIAEGLELEDGFIKVDGIAYDQISGSKKDIGIQLHSGRNRIVRRIFESLGYTVVNLDRVVYAGLTKKDLPRGKWRFLTETEVSFLRMK